MARRSISNGGVLACDADGCPEKFTTYSMLSLTRAQAANVGWSRVPATAAMDEKGKVVANGFGKKKVDLCPKHKPVPVTRRMAP